ncbi:MAG: translation initiation factor IF-3 [Candidatus Omnitrophota bacterium]|nr:MAG: translation initiation factor IF-3 [Candidatus Omnitrophota bacterium]
MFKHARTNNRIRADKIRLIGKNGEQLGVTSVEEGLRQAQEDGLDLVEVAPQAKPSVCRIMDYSKYKYEQEKKEKLAKKHQKKIRVKEIKLGPKIEEHDYQVKLKHTERFLSRGDKVKVTLRFRGREMAHQEMGRRLVDKFIKDIAGVGQVERGPITEGRFINTVFAPK